jgi:heme exporter protein A
LDPKKNTVDNAPLLTLDGIACTRGARRLFSGITQSLAPGELLRVQGPNGAGKTSLLRMLCGLLAPTEGLILWRGEKLNAQRATFGHELVYLGHAAALKDELSPLENMRDACALGGHPTNAAAALAALRAAGLRGHEHTVVRRLSQGQRRRSALARLALCEAPLWVLDEPFNALDVAATAWLSGLIEAHLQRAGMVVLTSHQDVALSAAQQQVLQL